MADTWIEQPKVDADQEFTNLLLSRGLKWTELSALGDALGGVDGSTVYDGSCGSWWVRCDTTILEVVSDALRQLGFEENPG